MCRTGEAERLACVELARIAIAGEGMLLGDAIVGFALLLHHVGRPAEAFVLLSRLTTVDAKAELRLAAAALTAELQQALPPALHAATDEDAHLRELGPWLEELAARRFEVAAASVPMPTIMQTGGIHVPTTGETLSPREVDVLRLIASGANNAEISRQLVISLHTTKSHVAHILAKLNVASRTAAALCVRELELT